MSSQLEARVRSEVEALHEFFVGWFSGALSKGELDSGFLRRLAPDFLLVPPAGTLLRLEDLAEGVRQSHGSNPGFRIAIRNVTLRREWDGHALATYEEWQRNALASTPADNGRLATVLFRVREPLEWLHIHETWLPAEVMSAGPYDF